MFIIFMCLFSTVLLTSCGKNDEGAGVKNSSDEGKLLIGTWTATKKDLYLYDIRKIVFKENGTCVISWPEYSTAIVRDYEGKYSYDAKTKELITTVQSFSFYVKLLTNEDLTIQQFPGNLTYSDKVFSFSKK